MGIERGALCVPGCCGVYGWELTTAPVPNTTLWGFLVAALGSILFTCSLLCSLDENECADTTACPAYATCTNTVGGYYCTCKRGFVSSNSQAHFSSPGVECVDVDECSASPPRCGPHASCLNKLGRFECRCLRGFTSPAGDVWVSERPRHLACTDVDECAAPGACPEHALCANEPGSYRCTCRTGFLSRGDACTDVDECSQNSTLCGPNSICLNLSGHYNCSCQPGFALAAPQRPGALGPAECADVDECADARACPVNATCSNVPGSYVCTCPAGFAPASVNSAQRGVECGDIDECAQDPPPCGPNAECSNAPGSYSCRCAVGFRPRSQALGNFSCGRVPFKCREDVIPRNQQVQQCRGGAPGDANYTQASFCALMNVTFSALDQACENRSNQVSLQRTVENLATVVEQVATWTELTRKETSTLATVLLESVESTTLAALLKPSANASQTIRTEHLEIESKVISEECSENVAVDLKARGDAMKVACSIIGESKSTGTTGVAFVSFVNMESVLDQRFFSDPRNSSKIKLRMNSRVVGGFMTGENKDNFSKPVIYSLENVQPKQEFEEPICVSWHVGVEEGRWTPSGCSVLEVSETHTICSCNRMANLAVIMASGELTMEFSLYVISHVGMIISLVCLVLAVITFLLCRTIRNHNTYLHLHLCVCLLLAKTLFLTGIDKTDNQMGCAIIAGFLHYLFLACFFWMLVEAVMLFLMVRNLKVVNYFSSRNIKILHLCAFGYGLPGLVVAVSAGVQPWGYGMHNRCWLNTETGFIWSFLGPVCVIILVNSVLLGWTLWILRQNLCSVNAEVSKLKDNRLLTFKAFAQLFILGCTWVLGIFQVGPLAGIMAYLFTVINSLQGAFIFLIHCLLSRQVREEYRSWFCRKTTPSSQPQTSGMQLSSVPSTSKTTKDFVSSTESAAYPMVTPSYVSWDVNVDLH
ncbi:adhesion G protein-coupled receptor E1 [Ctenodactylus gundi]